MRLGRRTLFLGLLAVACDVKAGREPDTRAPGKRKPRRRGGGGKENGLDDDPAVVQATVELEREAGLHLRLVGDEHGERSPAALRAAVLRRGGGRIAAERVHVQPQAGPAEVRFDFFYPAEATPAGAGPAEVSGSAGTELPASPSPAEATPAGAATA